MPKILYKNRHEVSVNDLQYDNAVFTTLRLLAARNAFTLILTNLKIISSLRILVAEVWPVYQS
jgi:hypothetical protein